MLKYRIIFISMFVLVIIGFLYPFFNNEKNIWLDDGLESFKIVTSTETDTTTNYYVFAGKDTVEVRKRVFADIKRIRDKNYKRNYDFVGAFDDDGIVYKIYSSRYKQSIFFFRFTEKVNMFEDCCLYNFGIFSTLLYMVIAFSAFFFVMIFYDENLSLEHLFFVMLSYILYILVNYYAYTYFETAFIMVPSMIIFILLFTNFYKILNNYNHKRKIFDILKSKTKNLENNYQKLIGDN